MTKEKLINAREKIWNAKSDIELMEHKRKSIHEAFEPVLRVGPNVNFWPPGFSGSTFIDLEVEFDLIDATVDLARERLAHAEKIARDLAQYLKIDDLYRRMKQTPPTGRNGITIEQEFDQAFSNLEVSLEDIPPLKAELEYHLTNIKTLVP